MGSGASAPSDTETKETKVHFMGRPLAKQQLVMVDGFRVPVSLIRCRDELYQQGLGKPDLFKRTCSAPEVNEIVECIEKGENFEGERNAYAVSEAFKKFLRSMPEGLLHEVQELELEIGTSASAQWGIFVRLNDVARGVLIWTIRFLGEVASKESQNGMSPEKLATAISDCFISELSSKLDMAAASERWSKHITVWIAEAKENRFDPQSGKTDFESQAAEAKSNGAGNEEKQADADLKKYPESSTGAAADSDDESEEDSEEESEEEEEEEEEEVGAQEGAGAGKLEDKPKTEQATAEGGGGSDTGTQQPTTSSQTQPAVDQAATTAVQQGGPDADDGHDSMDDLSQSSSTMIEPTPNSTPLQKSKKSVEIASQDADTNGSATPRATDTDNPGRSDSGDDKQSSGHEDDGPVASETTPSPEQKQNTESKTSDGTNTAALTESKTSDGSDSAAQTPADGGTAASPPTKKSKKSKKEKKVSRPCLVL